MTNKINSYYANINNVKLMAKYLQPNKGLIFGYDYIYRLGIGNLCTTCTSFVIYNSYHGHSKWNKSTKYVSNLKAFINAFRSYKSEGLIASR